MGDLIETNAKSIGKGYPYSKILYLDTGSITCNKIESLQECEIGEAPSRAKRMVRKEDIIYSSVRPDQLHYGFIKNPQDNLVVSTGFVTITCNKAILYPKFLYYYLIQSQITEYLHSVAEASTTAYPSLRSSDIEALDIEIPPIDEQKRIAGVLSSLDDKIDLLNRENTTLEALAETLFRHYFIENPDPTWKEVSLSSIATFLNGLACQKYPPKDLINRLPVLKIKELSSGITKDSDWATTDVGEEFIVHSGDVIFAWSASLMVKMWNGEDCVLNQHLFKVTSDIYPRWFYYLWCKYHLQEFISIAQSHATTMGHIKRGDLDSAMVLVPSKNEMETFTKQIEPLLKKVEVNYSQIKDLSIYRDNLLPRLISGEVKAGGQ